MAAILQRQQTDHLKEDPRWMHLFSTWTIQTFSKPTRLPLPPSTRCCFLLSEKN